MKKNNILITIIFIFNSCLENSLQPVADVSIEQTAEVLQYVEANGDYINSSQMPSLISAENLFNEKGTSLIIDIRSQEKFANGHIENALNKNPSELISYLEANDISQFSKIVLVSQTGEAASYYTALLRILNFNNIYALKFGMASWHPDFSEIWLESININPFPLNFDNEIYPKPDYSNLPPISLNKDLEGIEEQVKNRIQLLFAAGFEERISFPFAKNNFADGKHFADSDPTIMYRDIYQYITPDSTSFKGIFILCFGEKPVYHPFGKAGSDPSLPAHPPSAVWYKSGLFPDFRSIAFLQTIPNNKTICVYSLAGQQSAFITAYLRLLGYNAKSIIFGMNSFHYNAIAFNDQMAEYVFKETIIKNYPYVTGN